MSPQQERAQLMSRSWFLNAILHQKGQDSLDKWVTLGLGREKHKMSLELFVMPESKEGRDIGMVGTCQKDAEQVHLKRMPLAKSGTI